MKVDQVELDKEEVQIVKKATDEQRKELKLVNRLRPQPGQKVFEIDTKSGEVKEAEIHYENTVMLPLNKAAAKYPKSVLKRMQAKKGKIVAKENCFYTTALNEKNAIKHYIQALRVYYSEKGKQVSVEKEEEQQPVDTNIQP